VAWFTSIVRVRLGLVPVLLLVLVSGCPRPDQELIPTGPTEQLPEPPAPPEEQPEPPAPPEPPSPAESAELVVGRTEVDFTAVAGTQPRVQQVHLGSSVEGVQVEDLRFEVVAEGASWSPAWLSVGLDATVTPAGLTISPDARALSPGTYVAFIRIRSGPAGIPQTVTVTFVVTPEPTPLHGLSATLSGRAVRLEWVNDASGATSVEIERCAGEGCTDFALLIALEGTATSWVDQGQVAPLVAATHRYRVRTFTRSSGPNGRTHAYSAYSNVVAILAPEQPPAAPSNLSGELVSGELRLTWVDNASNETGFEIKICGGLGVTGCELKTVEAGATSAVLRGLTVLATYAISIRALGTAGSSQFSAPILISIPPPVCVVTGGCGQTPE
jgi:hypothetical protein